MPPVNDRSRVEIGPTDWVYTLRLRVARSAELIPGSRRSGRERIEDTGRLRHEVHRKVISRVKALTELERGQPDLVGALRKRRRAGRSERLRARAVKGRLMPEKASPLGDGPRAKAGNDNFVARL